jgi:hypothetical protein
LSQLGLIKEEVVFLLTERALNKRHRIYFISDLIADYLRSVGIYINHEKKVCFV